MELSQFFNSWIIIAGVVLALAVVLMPLYVIQMAGDARKTRLALERIEELLEAQQRVGSGNVWQGQASEPEDAPTIYPTKSARGPRRLT